MKFKGLYAVLAVAGLMGGCVSAPIERQSAQLAFDYEADRSAKSYSETIAIVSPSFVEKSDNRQVTSVYGQQAPSTNFNQRFFAGGYADKLEDAMASGFQQLISQKGFKFVGPYRNFDEITYTDKKHTYLAIIPDIDLSFEKIAGSPSCSGKRCVEEGQVEVSGDFSFKLVEPLTQQTFMTKRISLSDLRIVKDYRSISDNPKHNPNDLVGMALTAAIQQIGQASKIQGGTEENTNVDTSDKALSDAVSEFYTVAMGRMDTYLSAEEILSFSRDVKALKEQKRY